MHIMSIVGARPQFIKLAPFSAEVRRRGHQETVVHTGQHYDEGMSARFFMELDMAEPATNLAIGSGGHGKMTARALEGIELEIMVRKPDIVVVFGDTNSTLAGALAAAKLGVRSAHIEAGMRSFDRAAPEEVNRIVADHCCDLLLASNETAVSHLTAEGLGDRTTLVGDIMTDTLNYAISRAPAAGEVLRRLRLPEAPFVLLTVHRAVNTDDPGKLRSILDGVTGAKMVVFPVHPRTRAVISQHGIVLPANVHHVEPLGYFDNLSLQRGADVVATDSGGMQKEAYLLETPCVTLREETEWTETLELGWNVLTGSDSERIAAALAAPPRGGTHPPVYGEGHAAAAILDAIEGAFRR
ncbi:UDP-N-acetyl glucosamine 2-epimerase [bacterium SCGC AG-212-C10]|nr:UDP-N-acetyl glucosamine 2-epimerase [bacterium SCGC AG-212-C10]